MKRFVLQREVYPEKSPEFTIPYADLLNPAQLKAVYFDKGASLVIAGAGTGKTRTLTYRVACLIEKGIKPEEILLLTFTRRAAREMLSRAANILDERCSRVRGGTFHYYCSQILHQHADRIGFPANFTILDAADASDTIQVIRSGMNVAKLEKRFPKKGTLYSIISASVNRGMTIRKVVTNQYPQFEDHLDGIEDLAAKYIGYKKRNHVMDFDDLLTYTSHLFNEDLEVHKLVSGKNRYVMIDEYQDTNALQARLVKQFSWVHKNVMAVGDDAQSIYSFRGADHKNIMSFPEVFKPATIVKLEQNYRSTSNILRLANRILDQTDDKFQKTLHTDKLSGELPALVKARDDREQSRFVAQMVLNLRESGFELNDSAVLFRNGRDAFDLEIELNRREIPYVKYGGQKFTDAAHIKDLMAFFRILVNVNDTIAWNRVLLLLPGIGPKTAGDMVEWLLQQDEPYRLGKRRPNAKYQESLTELGGMLYGLKENDVLVPDAAGRIIDFYKPLCERMYDDHPKRIRDLETFRGIAENYTSLAQLLEDMALDPIERTVVDTESVKPDEAPLVLSTIHSAKGLEWSNVFVIQCVDGVIPSSYSIKNEGEIDEELRLFYVACTRAKDHLFLTYPVTMASEYGDYFTNPSRFLKDIPEQQLEPWMLVEDHGEGQELLEE